MDITRRRLLSFVPAAALLTAVNPAPASATSSGSTANRGASATRAAGTAQLLANLVGIFAGTPESNARPEVTAKLAAIDQTARTWLAAMDRAGRRRAVRGAPARHSDPNLTTSFQHLYEIALATRAPGPASDLQGNAASSAG